MKIAMIGQKKVPSREGGVEIVVEELAVRMAALGHAVTLYNRRDPSEKTPLREYKGVRIRNIPTLHLMGSDALVYAFFAAFAAIFGHYDVIHFHAEGPSGMAWLTRLFRIPTVVTNHGLDWQRGKWGGLASRYLKTAEGIGARCADEFIVLSDNGKQYFRETYGIHPHFIRNGVSMQEPKEPLEISGLGLEKNKYVLYLARLVPEKGVHYLIEAFRGVQTDCRLVIAGRLSDNDYIQQLKQMAAQDERVLLPGFVQGRLLEELFTNCRVYVLPSDVEGMPLSLLEALSCGAPCLVSDIPQNQVAPEIYLTQFQHSQVADLREKLQTICDTAPEDRLRGQQIQWMQEYYGWDAVVDETLAVYNSAICKRKGESAKAAAEVK